LGIGGVVSFLVGGEWVEVVCQSWVFAAPRFVSWQDKGAGSPLWDRALG